MANLAKYKAYPEYKDSGVEWLGEIPESWELNRGKVVFMNSRLPSKVDDEQLAASQKYGVIPQGKMMELNDAKVMLALKGTESFRHVEKHNFVISLRSFEGGIEHSEYIGCVSPAYTVLQAKDIVNPYFFKYLFKSKSYISVLQATTDSLRDGKSISYEQFSKIYLPNISLYEQTKTVSFLDHETAKIDLLIEKQQKLIELLKEKRQAVISHAVTKGLNPNIKMKDSGIEWLGEVPEHWISTQIKYGYHVTLGKMLQPEKKQSNELLKPYLKAQNIQPSGVSLEKIGKMWFSRSERNKLRLRQHDVLVSEGGDVGRAAIWNNEVEECYIQNAINRVRSSENSTKYFLYWIGVLKHTGFIDIMCNKATIAHYTAEKLKESVLLLPPYEEQVEIASHLYIFEEKAELLIQKANHQIELMQERRTALISAAVTGKIDVRDWQAPTPSALQA